MVVAVLDREREGLVAEGAPLGDLLGVLLGVHELEGVGRERPAVHLVEAKHVEGRGGGALLHVAVDVEVVVARTVVDEAVDRVGVGVEGEEHWDVLAEELGEAGVADGGVVLVGVLDREELDDVDELHLEAHVLQGVGGGEHLERRHVAAGGEHDVRLLARGAVAGPGPLGHALGELLLGVVDGLEGGGRLLAREDRVDLVRGLVGLLADREQHVGVGRVVDLDDVVVVEVLVQQQVDEAGVLVREAVVVLAPDVAGEQDVEAGDGLAPGDVAHGGLEPLGVLVDHGVDDVHEGLVGAPHAVAAGEQEALEKALALVLGELLDDGARAGEEGVVLLVAVEAGVPLLVGQAVGGLETVRGGLVGTEDAEVREVELHDVGGVLAEDARGLGHAVAVAVALDVDLVVVDVGQLEVGALDAAVGVGVGAQAQVALRHELGDLGAKRAVLVPELLGLVGAQPAAEHAEVLVGVLGAHQGHLVRTPGVLGLLAVDELRAGPALGGLEDDHRVLGTGGLAGKRAPLDVADLVEDLLEQGGEATVDRDDALVVEAGREGVGVVAHAAEELVALLVGDAREDRRVGDLVAVEVQHRQDDAVGERVQQLVGLPGRGKRAGLGLAVADDREREEARVVENRAVGVGERVAELAALVDGAGGLGREVAGDAAGVGELAEELLEAGLVVGDVGTDLAIGAVKQRLRGARRSAVARPHEEHDALAVVVDEAVDMAHQEVQARGGAPVADETVLDVLAAEVADVTAGVLEVGAHQRVAAQVDLADGHVVGSTPVLVDPGDLLLRDGEVELLPWGTQILSHLNSLTKNVYLTRRGYVALSSSTTICE